ncbi:hypothetical protein GSI_12329 [Ganoderma sinense ZZ0214-1]|uniref:Uncharacterized protein n=1 Tax=Ganoderma sinense ZZ0214-1 TaxID=1077348 RepID=A0A2G8RYH8_9APHY|nr:hypothetical protein GSI_12329 [Ganoderma sinense ZZ0214-1]
MHHRGTYGAPPAVRAIAIINHSLFSCGPFPAAPQSPLSCAIIFEYVRAPSRHVLGDLVGRSIVRSPPSLPRCAVRVFGLIVDNRSTDSRHAWTLYKNSSVGGRDVVMRFSRSSTKSEGQHAAAELGGAPARRERPCRACCV